MAKPKNEIQLIVRGASEKMSLSLTPQAKVETKYGKRSDGIVPADKNKTKIIFKLAEVALLDAPKRHYLQDPSLQDIDGLRIVTRGKRLSYSFQPSGAPPMPRYLRFLALEMSGLTKW